MFVCFLIIQKEEFSERLRLGAPPAVTTPDHPLQGGFEDVAKSVGGSSLCLLIASLTLEHPTRAAQCVTRPSSVRPWLKPLLVLSDAVLPQGTGPVAGLCHL